MGAIVYSPNSVLWDAWKDACDWPTHLGNGGVVVSVEEWWDSSQFDYEAGLPTEGQRSLAFCRKWWFDSPANHLMNR